jgi:hypothetical protein
VWTLPPPLYLRPTLVLHPFYYSSDLQICQKCGPGEEAIRLVVGGVFVGRCRSCPAGEYNGDAEGKCTECPFNSTTLRAASTSPTDCLCVSGFTTGTSLPYALGPCVPCGSAVVCPGGGRPELAAAGHFLTSWAPLTTQRCWPHTACAGLDNQPCAAGYEGWGCTACASGYSRRASIPGLQAPTPYCLRCEGGGAGVGGWILMLVIHGLAVWAWLRLKRPPWVDSVVQLTCFAVHGMYFFGNIDLRWTGQFSITRNSYGIQFFPLDSTAVSGLLFVWISRGLAPAALIPNVVDAAVPVCSSGLSAFSTVLTLIGFWAPALGLAYLTAKRLPGLLGPSEVTGVDQSEPELLSRCLRLVLMQCPAALLLIGYLATLNALVLALCALPLLMQSTRLEAVLSGVLTPCFRVLCKRKYTVEVLVPALRPFVWDFGVAVAWGLAPALAHCLIVCAVIDARVAPVRALVTCVVVLLLALVALVVHEPYSTERTRVLALASVLVQWAFLVGGILIRGGHVGSGQFVAIVGCIIPLHAVGLVVVVRELWRWWRPDVQVPRPTPKRRAVHTLPHGPHPTMATPPGRQGPAVHGPALTRQGVPASALAFASVVFSSRRREIVERQADSVVHELRPVLGHTLDQRLRDADVQHGLDWLADRQEEVLTEVVMPTKDVRGAVVVMEVDGPLWGPLVRTATHIQRFVLPAGDSDGVVACDALLLRLLRGVYRLGLPLGWSDVRQHGVRVQPFTLKDVPPLTSQASDPGGPDDHDGADAAGAGYATHSSPPVTPMMSTPLRSPGTPSGSVRSNSAGRPPVDVEEDVDLDAGVAWGLGGTFPGPHSGAHRGGGGFGAPFTPPGAGGQARLNSLGAGRGGPSPPYGGLGGTAPPMGRGGGGPFPAQGRSGQSPPMWGDGGLSPPLGRGGGGRGWGGGGGDRGARGGGGSGGPSPWGGGPASGGRGGRVGRGRIIPGAGVGPGF